ncbi:SURF1 family protein [uncultured Ramlibacter sp.]|uniref:SURF1 family protein n=1 Tax=uncultured Ramlibacter sp. TaxID=260755 RepID=UPI00263A3A29|nr:SURF1 family protein [uncultured Ramlibacter sp.]
MNRARAGRFWLITAAAAVGIAATASLGAWQLSRAAQKQGLQSAIEARKNLVALDNTGLSAIKSAADAVWQPVALRGRWAPQHTVFLDNRQMQAKPGFYVLTPLLLDGGGAVVVQRGWVQRNFSEREKLPALDTPQGPVEVRGRIAPPPAKLYEFAAPAAGAIRQNLDLAAYAAQTGLPLRQDLSLQQTGPASEGLLRDWPEVGSGTEKHYGYAFQWFALAGLIAILYVWFQFIAARGTARHA